MSSKPTLWHIPVSHYNEKVRWALAYKGVEHGRRAAMPGAHMLVALALSRGASKTFPVLQINGTAIGDSTEIIAELERLHPDPPLYPGDPAERARALELEEFFDEELGPQIRQMGWHLLIDDPERLRALAVGMAPGPLAKTPVASGAFARNFLRLRYDAGSEEGAAASWEKVLAALDRLEAELDGNEYLVGDGFTVADLTAASLFYPLVLPPEAPRALSNPTPRFEELRAPLVDRPGYVWVADMFARHRKPSPAL